LTVNTTEAGVVILGFLALVAIVALFRFRHGAKVRIKGPGGSGLEVDGSNDAAPAIRAEGVKSRTGGLVADDRTGRGVDAKGIDVEKDVRLSSKPNDPKA